MCPITHASYLALGSAFVASFVFGFLWYGPLFGKIWADLVGVKLEEKPKPQSMIIAIIGTFLTTFVMAYIMKQHSSYCPFAIAFLIWLGFNVPLLLSLVAWEGRSWKLFVLNAVYYFLNLQLVAFILTFIK